MDCGVVGYTCLEFQIARVKVCLAAHIRQGKEGCFYQKFSQQHAAIEVEQAKPTVSQPFSRLVKSHDVNGKRQGGLGQRRPRQDSF